MTRRIRLTDDRGATAVEFALVIPVTLAVLGALLTLALQLTYAALAEKAAQVGLRTASVYSASGYADQSAVQTKVTSLYPTSLVSAGEVEANPALTTSAAGSGAQGDFLTVTVTYDVPGIRAAARLIPNVGPFADMRTSFLQLGTVKRTASGRRE